MIPRFATQEDAELITSICGHPEVRRWTALPDSPPFDAGRWLRHGSRDLVVLVEGGCFLSNWLGDRTWEVHTHFLPEARGRNALQSSGLALMLAFLSRDVETFVTKVPSGNPAAAWLAKAMGFRPTFGRAAAWDGQDVQHFRLDIDDWVLQGHLVPVGQAFHTELEAAGHASHAEDTVHDAYVGTAIALLNAGLAPKALRLYNRWALGAGYAPFKVIQQSPLTLYARDFTVTAENGKLKIESKEKDHA